MYIHNTKIYVYTHEMVDAYDDITIILIKIFPSPGDHLHRRLPKRFESP